MVEDVFLHSCIDEQVEKLYFFTKNKAKEKLTLHFLPLNDKIVDKDRIDIFNEEISRIKYVFIKQAYNLLKQVLMKSTKDEEPRDAQSQ